MATYDNAYEMVDEVRHSLNEHSEALVQGQAKGTHSNNQILKAINKAQLLIHAFLFKRDNGLFLTDADLTGVNSVYTLPSNFAKLALFRDETGRKVFPIVPSQTKRTAATGSDRLYLRKGNTLVLDKAGVTETYKLWYYTKPRDIHLGRLDAGAAQSMTLDDRFGKAIDDYYNGMMIEIMTGTKFIDTITDYTGSSRVAVVAGTGVKGSFYGLVSELPQPFHSLIPLKAAIHIKATSPVAQEKPTQVEINEFGDLLQATVANYVTDAEDIDYEEIFADFEPQVPPFGVISAE